ncbi:hypothetical protein [Streptomyces sp. B15]|nr:hypothetical protein [Streptomyces sp. B15]
MKDFAKKTVRALATLRNACLGRDDNGPCVGLGGRCYYCQRPMS